MSVAGVFAQLGLTLIERDWLSSNHIVFDETARSPATVVDTGYVSHSRFTESLLRHHLGPSPLGRIVNTHLHSDHCGGNAALQVAWDCEAWVPEASFELAGRWDETRLTYRQTGQRCDRFSVQRPLRPGESIELGLHRWQVVAAPGHDPHAVMLFEPESGVLITADALWEDRLAIIFPELDGDPGFSEARSALDTIERLAPRVVVPGHGRAFTAVADAVRKSRSRIEQFEATPRRHLVYATRALAMFHMLEIRSCSRGDLVEWLDRTPVFKRIQERFEALGGDEDIGAAAVVSRLLADGLLREADDSSLAVA